MLNSRHLGRFEIDVATINDNPEIIQGIMANVIVLEAKYRFDKNVIEYLAISDENFEAVADSEQAPTYDISVSSEDGGETYSIDFVKQA